jgi:superfamily II DNA/RNA helicase
VDALSSAAPALAPSDSVSATPPAAAEVSSPAGDEAGPRTTFADLGLSEVLLRAIAEKGYVHPTPIQEQAIPIVLQGRDVLGSAQTGTGKTASFTLPMMEILSGSRARARMPRSLILEPTRELALQVAENFVLYGKYLKLNHALLIGGESLSDQKEVLMRGVDVLIATPGRLIDMFERGGLLLSDTRILVIDEADRMLDMGFIPDVERIVSLLPTTRQTLFFSATMAKEIRRLADAFLQNPREITTSAPASVATTITAGLAVVAEEDKRRALRHLIRSEEVQNALIFCNRKRDVDILYKSLQRHGFSVGALHGDMVQAARFATLEKFRAGEIRLLVCSDVAARGIDIGGLSHVFNFDVPHHAEDYVHRIGRTGRAGREGRAFTIAAPDQHDAVLAIEKLTGAPVPRIAIEGFEALEWSESTGDHRRHGGKGKSKAASGGKASHSKGKTAAPRAAAEKPALVEAEPADAKSPSDTRGRGARGPGQPTRDRGAARQDAPRTLPSGDHATRRAQLDRDNGAPVIGFGDDIPAFMLIRRRSSGIASVDVPGFVAGADPVPEGEDDKDQR